MAQECETIDIEVVELPSPPNVWTKEEHAQMLCFMDENREFLLDNIQRNIRRMTRANKAHFFVRMSTCIGTKSDKQCKSRYQKKERQLLKELDFPHELVDEYMRSKREKNRKNAAEKSGATTDASDSMLKLTETPSDTITNFTQLRNAIISDFMPRVTNNVVLMHLKNFVQSFPTTEQSFTRAMPSLSISPLRFYQPSVGFSIDLLPDPEIVFVEDCD